MIVFLEKLGFRSPHSWPFLIISSIIWLGLLIAYSPVADEIASYIYKKPPRLGAFKSLQKSFWNLFFGIIIAWLLGGFLEEIFLRGIILQYLQKTLGGPTNIIVASGIAIIVAALIAGIIHLYQGPRGAIIIAQLSIMFGILFVINGNILWSTIICHGLYDTIAFVRFANKQSKYSQESGE